MSNAQDSGYSLKIGKRSFIMAFLIILALMIFSGVLTRVVPAGTYDRLITDGVARVVPGTYTEVARPDYPAWRWLTAPVEVLFAPGNIVLITIILFLLLVGGAFSLLEQAGVLRALLSELVHRFRERRYVLMAVLVAAFMLAAALLGIYEALVPMVVLVVPLARALGWDSVTGLGMSLLPLAFGFASGVFNPFTVGVAQRIAELPLFSGSWLRLLFLGLIYVLVLIHVRRYAMRVEADPSRSLVSGQDVEANADDFARSATDAEKRGYRAFGIAIVLAFSFVLVTSRIPSITDLAFPVMALLFLIGGLVGSGLAGMTPSQRRRVFLKGALLMLPAILLVSMATSVRYIVDQGLITDSILHSAAERIAGVPPFGAALMLYGLTLIMNFFVGSASAKGFLMMPVLAPLADLVGVTRQTAVLAFSFGDGFSNVMYPSNPLLMIALGLTIVSYPKWMRFTISLQAQVFLLTVGFLWLATAIGYGPF